jgi:hypothetical protein
VTDETAPRELVVDARPAPGDQSDGSGTAMAPIAITVLVAGLVAKLVSPAAALVVVALAAAFFVLRRKPNLGHFVLRVDAGVLEVTREKKGADAIRVPLVDLVDVTLDRAAKAPSGRGGAPAERVRIALERRAAPPIYVPEERVTAIEAHEWYGKVRVFLRKHGWSPDGG